MRYRSSRTLVFHNDGDEFVACNFLTKAVFECSPDLLDFLGAVADWSDRAAIREQAPGYSEDELDETLAALAEMSALVVEGSNLEMREDAFRRHWKWGVPAALMHFCVQDPEYMSLNEAEDLQRAAFASDGEIELYSLNSGRVDVTALPEVLSGNSLLQLMAKRRTQRKGLAKAVSVPALSEALFAGLGITGTARNAVVTLPLSMTPSGGARNPYEAYIFVKAVDGLAPGIYHYSAFEHSLAKISDASPLLADLVGGQEWADTMPCMIVLVAHMDRTMWKYSDPNAYRVVMIEAGHIGQNIMLSATARGMTACPTAALSHTMIGELIGLRNPAHAPIYALTLGFPDAT
ncbi:SagB/ThcOx family dehydrogenase [Rhizobium sullae]|uniref:Dehydrogenase n=1 Tax=Rhizobium sullae TaxID=50338 RepID=A0A2N0DCX2_RHISU|nr:SagB/ThcOx family dehydrogenase [Rhizobium sullae]PKA43945.1 dehydrogenase [Rhizobium sullae]UWU14184.1 SagB/ThcOx family dehydrogenase [Rhizobium sullae]